MNLSLPITNYAAVLSLCVLFLTSCGSESTKEKEEKSQGRQLDFTEEVTFLNADGAEISTVQVAVADDQEERNQGLMDVTNLDDDEGMIFIFPKEEELSFYMANTPLPLDILFVNSDSTIVRIHHSTTPFSNKQLESNKPARFVVETNGGYCVTHDIREGMKIRF